MAMKTVKPSLSSKTKASSKSITHLGAFNNRSASAATRLSKRDKLRAQVRCLMQQRIDSERGRQLLQLRKIWAEGCFATIRRVLGFERFRLGASLRSKPNGYWSAWALTCENSPELNSKLFSLRLKQAIS